jgi:hypothetical protein
MKEKELESKRRGEDLEGWNVGILENWNIVLFETYCPSFQRSIVPSLQLK